MIGPTLTAALAAAGYSHRPTGGPAREIVKGGNVVATLKAHEAWAWLRAQQPADDSADWDAWRIEHEQEPGPPQGPEQDPVEDPEGDGP